MRKRKTNVLLYILSLKWLAVGPVLFYKKCVSPLLPRRCPYYPSCSTYMLHSISRHGLIKGGALGLARLVRCTPFAKGGLDPVPYRKGDYKWLY